MNLKQLREKRQEIFDKIDTLLNKATAETRGLNADEKTAHDALKVEYNGLSEQINLRQEQESRAAELNIAPTPMAGGDDNADPRFRQGNASDVRSVESKMSRDYSLMNHIRSTIQGSPLGKTEKLVQDAASEEARSCGNEITGAGLPSWMLSAEKRASPVGVSVGTASTAWVEKTVGDLIPVLAPRLVAAEAGARVLTGLRGDLSLPSMDQTVATWETENAEADDAVGAVGGLLISPVRLAAFADITKRMLTQSSPDIERLIRENLSQAVAIKVDQALLDSGPNSLGTGYGALASLSGANLLALAGAIPTFANVVSLEGIVEDGNAPWENLAYVMTPKLRAALKTKARGTGDGFVIDGEGMCNGYKVLSTTNMPGATATTHSILFGNFGMSAIAQFGALDITVDQYTKATQGIVVLVVNSFWNTRILSNKAFAGSLTAGIA
jgi:HK97 family phage major capsid protein